MKKFHNSTISEYRIIIERRLEKGEYCAKIQKLVNGEWETVNYAHSDKWKVCMTRAVKKLDKRINEEEYMDNAYKWHMKWKEEFDKYRLK